MTPGSMFFHRSNSSCSFCSFFCSNWERWSVMICLLSVLTTAVFGVPVVVAASQTSLRPSTSFVTNLGVWRRLRLLQLKTRRQELRNLLGNQAMATYRQNVSHRSRYSFGLGKRSGGNETG
ncbi:hypothetical protein BV898_07398 [Hypsibius exemplaris]|uniref:Uncharacterized protein n=1 Tax=Hypsibius exemplaris TaxID=2072580 RepID=A0A1W0WTQ1_HYPEX|nr:hypothetical protein BV898_07398 [Hypsibius exemplaris]